MAVKEAVVQYLIGILDTGLIQKAGKIFDDAARDPAKDR